MPRSAWTGKLVCDSLVVDVAAYTTTEKQLVGLTNTCACHGKPIRQKYVCSETNEEVSRDTMGKAYQLGDKLIPIDVQELEALGGDRTERLNLRFAKEKQVADTRLMTDKTYYIAVAEEKSKRTKQVVADVAARQAYRILYEGLVANDAVAVGELTLRADGRSRPVIVKPEKGWLVMTMLHYSEQLKEFDKDTYDEKLEKEDLAAGKGFVADRIEKIDLSEFKDKYVENVTALIEKKPISVVKEKELPTPTAVARQMFTRKVTA